MTILATEYKIDIELDEIYDFTPDVNVTLQLVNAENSKGLNFQFVRTDGNWGVLNNGDFLAVPAGKLIYFNRVGSSVQLARTDV